MHKINGGEHRCSRGSEPWRLEAQMQEGQCGGHGQGLGGTAFTAWGACCLEKGKTLFRERERTRMYKIVNSPKIFG